MLAQNCHDNSAVVPFWHLHTSQNVYVTHNIYAFLLTSRNFLLIMYGGMSIFV